MNWGKIFSFSSGGEASVSIVDLGCGFGGFTRRLGEMSTGDLVLGLEIRGKVAEIAAKRLSATDLLNAAVIQTNAMKFFTNHFERNSLDKIFLCFADPHFKASQRKRRVVKLHFLFQI